MSMDNSLNMVEVCIKIYLLGEMERSLDMDIK